MGIANGQTNAIIPELDPKALGSIELIQSWDGEIDKNAEIGQCNRHNLEQVSSLDQQIEGWIRCQI